jgi:hypothetical protein
MDDTRVIASQLRAWSERACMEAGEEHVEDHLGSRAAKRLETQAATIKRLESEVIELTAKPVDA